MMKYNMNAPLNTIPKADRKSALEETMFLMEFNRLPIGHIADISDGQGWDVICADGMVVGVNRAE